MRAALVCLVVALHGCGDECDAPEEVQFACFPVAAGTLNACRDVDTYYPEDCEMTLTTCKPGEKTGTKCVCGLYLPGRWGCL
jgi:hypothetical protein